MSVEISTTNPTDIQSRTSDHYSMEAEKALLGALLVDEQVWDLVADRLKGSDFFYTPHRVIVETMIALESNSKPFDVITVAEQLNKQKQLENIGGAAYLGLLTESAISTANVTAYADIVRDHSITRQLFQLANDLVNSIKGKSVQDGRALIEEFEQRIFALSSANASKAGDYRDISSLLSSAMENVNELFQNKNEITGLPTSFMDLDRMIDGLQASELIVVAGRPSMGKTSLVMNFAENAVIRHNKSVLVFSLEMSAEQLTMRLLASLSRVPQQKLRRGNISDADWPRLTSTVSLLDDSRFFIDDTPALNVVEMRAKCRRVARSHGLDLVIVDYLQLMQGVKGKDNRVEEISEISRSLKALARELEVPVVALSQLNRGVESRQDKRPMMADLRDSGAIEQDADLILFIYRDEVYNSDTPRKGIADILIAKQRNGPTGQIFLNFNAQFTRFENFAAEQDSMV